MGWEKIQDSEAEKFTTAAGVPRVSSFPCAQFPQGNAKEQVMLAPTVGCITGEEPQV